MVQELLPLLPKEVGTLAMVLAMAGTLMGAGLWLVGARYSRSLITLLLVAVGGWIGLFLPRWCGWNIDGSVPAIAMALLLGGSGFVMHRFWVGVGLGVVLAGWATVAVWLLCRGAAVWVMPKMEPGVPVMEYSRAFWQSLPMEVQKVLPIAAGMAFLSGLLTTMLWPRVGSVLLYSMAGVSMVIGLGLCTINLARPQWVGVLPAKASSQLLAVSGMVLFGVLLQWQLGPVKKTPKLKSKMPLIVHD